VRPDELHQAFAFAFLAAPWDARAWCEAATGLLDAATRTGSPVTWVVENHDVVRTPTRYGGGPRASARARAALLAVLALPGSAYLYQGQELGLPEVDVPVSARQDPAWLRSGVTRDGARVPLPWTEAPAGVHGFSSSATAQPWLPVPEDGWGALSVAAQTRRDGSTLELCRAALSLRRRLHAEGWLTPDDRTTVVVQGGGLLVVDRARLRLAVNLGEVPEPLPEGDLLLATGPLDADGQLPPDTAVWLSGSSST